jgi:hypothetical protein
MSPQMTHRLWQDITTVCRNTGIAVEEPKDPPVEGGVTEQTLTIHPVEGVTTDAELDAGYAIYASFDQSPEAQAAWESEQVQAMAVEDDIAKSPEGQLRRAMDREMFDYFHGCVREHNNLCEKLGETNMLVTEQSWQQTYDLAKARVDAGGA